MKASIKPVYQAWVLAKQKTNKAFNRRLTGVISLPFIFIGGAILILVTPILNRVSRRRLVLFNIPALGHDMFEFLTFMDESSTKRSGSKTRMLYFSPKSHPINNRFLFQIWGRVAEDSGSISLRRVSPFTWSTLAWIASYRSAERTWLIPLHPTYSRYTALPKKRTLELFTAAEREDLSDLLLKALGAADSGYCVLGIRDGGFYQDTQIRDGNIEEFLPSIRYLLDLGIPVVRMGRCAITPLPMSHPLLFDYSFSDYVDDRMDVLLWAHASFALGDSTGLTDAVALFGSPIFVPAHPLDPRAFLSNPNVYFAIQQLVRRDSSVLTIVEVVDIMNTGVNIGDESVLESL